MPCHFLCSAHATQLSEHLDASAPIWSVWMRRGETARQNRDFPMASRYFGCAFDLAVMLVERYTAHAEFEGLRHVHRLLEAGDKLAESLARCGCLSLRVEFLGEVRRLLHREQQRTPLLADSLPGWQYPDAAQAPFSDRPDIATNHSTARLN